MNNPATNLPSESVPKRKYSALANLPSPRPLPSEYKKNLYLGFLKNPKRAYNFWKWKRSTRSEVLNYIPVKMDIEPVSRCNFHCTMCQVSDWKKYQRATDLTLESFKELIDSQYGVTELKLQGLGEPLLARDSFFEMVKYARSKNIWVRTTTNASLLHLNDNYKKLIDSGINEVQISFDGASKGTFEAIRRGSVFEKVVSNCTLVNKYSNDKNLLRTRMWVLLQQGNSAEFFQFIDLAVQMGFKRLTYSLDLIGWAIDSWIDNNSAVSAKALVTPEMAHEAIRIGKEKGVEVTFWNATDKYSSKSLKSLCAWPFERAYVSSDMRIVPCCMVANPDVYEIGKAKDFTAEWNGPAYREFRKAHIEGRIPKICDTCYGTNQGKSAPSKTSLNVIDEPADCAD